MKLEPVTKPDKRNKTTSTKFWDDVMSEIVTSLPFSFYGQFGAILKPDFGRIVCKTYIFINSNPFILQKLKTELKNLWHNCHTIALSKGTILTIKRWFFAKNADISKIKRALVLNGIFSETTYLFTYVPKFKVSSIILTSFRQGEG